MLKNSAKFLPNRTGQNQPNPEPNRNFGRLLLPSTYFFPFDSSPETNFFVEYCSKVLIDILTSLPELNSFKIFCLSSFLLDEIILATIHSVKFLSLGFWPCHYCLELSPVFINCYTIVDTVLLHIDKFLVIPDTLTAFWNILHIAALTPSGI